MRSILIGLRSILTDLKPLVALPPHVDDIAPASTLDRITIDQVYLGTCTNGRLQDLHVAAEILKGKHIAPGVRMIVVPASHQVLQEAVADGTLSISARSRRHGWHARMWGMHWTAYGGPGCR